jgi:UDP-GlcNAc:undecaprenyl-phosphate/decaprenyl-phosphate GlcNAc-1-phosphate transferase
VGYVEGLPDLVLLSAVGRVRGEPAPRRWNFPSFREEDVNVATLALYLGVLGLPLIGTSLLLPLLKRVCVDRGWLDYPGGRKQHRAPVPRLGGVAFFLSFATTVLVGFALAPSFRSLPAVKQVIPEVATALTEVHQVRTRLIGLLVGALVMFAVGLVDDLLGERFPVALKFLGQSLAALIAVGSGIQVEVTGFAFLNAAVSFFWIVGIANAFNLLDNMDGLAVGVAVSSAFIFFLNAFALGEFFLCLVLAAFVGALLGFMRLNVHPARIFMGDCGALFIGFVLSSLTILEHYVSPASSSLFPVLMPPLVLAVPLIDTLSVIVIRISERRPIYRGDRCHLSHRLVAAGLPEPQAVKLLVLLTLAFGMGALHLADASVARSLWTATYTSAVAVLVLSGIGLRARATPPRLRAHESTKTAEGL